MADFPEMEDPGIGLPWISSEWRAACLQNIGMFCSQFLQIQSIHIRCFKAEILFDGAKQTVVVVAFLLEARLDAVAEKDCVDVVGAVVGGRQVGQIVRLKVGFIEGNDYKRVAADGTQDRENAGERRNP